MEKISIHITVQMYSTYGSLYSLNFTNNGSYCSFDLLNYTNYIELLKYTNL